MKIAFIGLGNMGSGMAANLLTFCQSEGHTLGVFDLNQDVVDRFVKLGASTANSIAALVADAELVFTSLPTSKEVNLVALESQGLLANLPDGATWFETSTNELAEWQNLRSQARVSLNLIDAPVTGGSEGAAAGTLTMLVGEDAAKDKSRGQSATDRYSEVLTSFTNNVVTMGPAGAGYVTKLCQLHLNYLVAQGIGEALMLGAKANLDLANLHEVLQNSCAQSYVVDSYIPKVLDGSYDPSFTLGLATKDMRLVTELGKHLDVPLSMADEVYASYQTATQEFGAGEPHLKIVKLLEDKVGQLLRTTEA